LADSLLGQHLALSVAAHLARTQLVPDPLSVYDAQHMSEMVDVVANALARVVPLYAQDPGNGAPRQLMEGEIEGARVKRGATVLVLKDGRTLSAVSIKRADLRQAIAILKAVGIQELGRRAPPEAPKPGPADRVARLRAALAEIEGLLRLPLVPTQAERANALLVSVARNAPDGRIANLAMRLMSTVHEARDSAAPDERQINVMLARLRAALHERSPAPSRADPGSASRPVA
jgi:hypothetical protein